MKKILIEQILDDSENWEMTGNEEETGIPIFTHKINMEQSNTLVSRLDLMERFFRISIYSEMMRFIKFAKSRR